MKIGTQCLFTLTIFVKTGLITCDPAIIGPTQLQILENSNPDSIIGYIRLSGTPGTEAVLVAVGETLALVSVKPVNTTTYSINLFRSLDREMAEIHILRFDAVNKSGNTIATKTVQLQVLDTNDNAPVFQRYIYSFSIPENKKNSILARVVATDADQGSNAQISYSLKIKSPPKGDYLQIDNMTGVITLVHPLDYESNQLITYNVLAKDSGSPQLTGTAEIRIHVIDVQDEPPVFIRSFYSTTVAEEAPIMTWLLQVSAVDGDTGLSDEIRYNIERDDCGELFSSSAKTGSLYTRVVLDRESKLIAQNSGVCTLVMRAYKVNSNDSSEVDVRIEIVGLDEFKPVFDKQTYRAGIEENAAVNSIIDILDSDGIHVTDQDEGEGGSVSLSLRYPNGTAVTGLSVLTTGLTGSKVYQLVLIDTVFLDGLKQGTGEAIVEIVAESSPFQKSSATVHITMFRWNKQPCANKDTSHSPVTIPYPTTDPSHTCQHGGVYVDTDGSVHCYCAPGYVGKHCELDLDECMYNPCENNGTCINTPGSYKCACTDGQLGPHCTVSDCQDTVGFPCWVMVVFKMCDDAKIAGECSKSCNKCPQPGGQQGSVIVG